MSQTETHIGKLSKVPLGHHTVEEWCEEYCTINSIKMSSYHFSWESCFMDYYDDEHVICMYNEINCNLERNNISNDIRKKTRGLIK